MRLASSFKQLIVYSIIFAEVSVIIGLISGYYLSIPPGGTIVLVAIIILIISLAIKKTRSRPAKGVV